MNKSINKASSKCYVKTFLTGQEPLKVFFLVPVILAITSVEIIFKKDLQTSIKHSKHHHHDRVYIFNLEWNLK